MHYMPKTNQIDPFDLPLCTCANLRRTTRAVTQAFEAALQPVELTPTQFTTLAALAQKGPTALTTLAEALGTDRTTLNRNLKPLLRRDLVLSETGEDQRQRVLGLTKEGNRVLKAAIPLWRDVQGTFVDAMGRKNWTALIGGLGLANKTARRA